MARRLQDRKVEWFVVNQSFSGLVPLAEAGAELPLREGRHSTGQGPINAEDPIRPALAAWAFPLARV